MAGVVSRMTTNPETKELQMIALHHRPPTRRTLLRSATIATIVLTLVAPLLLAPQVAGAETTAGEPALAYKTSANDIVVAGDEGQVIGSFTTFKNLSLNGSVIAVERKGRRPFQRHIVGFDAVSGERLFRIPNGFLPVVAAGGTKVAFLPVAEREESVMSVWMRTPTGSVRKIIQFQPGPGLPGVRHGMRAGGGPLEFALDKRGRTMAVAFGLETISVFDVWMVDVKTKQVTRMTRNNHSHSPSLSPNGSKLAVRVESTETCSDPFYGEYFMGKIRVISPATGERKTLTRFDCDLFYGDPRFIDNDSLLTTRITRDAGEEFGFDLDIVRIDVATGEITDVVTDGNPCCLRVSPSSGKVVYEFSDRPGFSMLDFTSGAVIDFGENNFWPLLSGQNRV
jgi:hypothetical protein